MTPNRFLRPALCTGAFLSLCVAFCANAFAAEKVTIGSLRDPAHHAVVWPIINGKVSDPNLNVAVELLSIPASYQAVLTKQYDAVIMATAGLPRLAEQGLNFKVFALLYRYSRDGNGTSVWVLKDSPYKTIDDLKGKRIATAALESGGTVAVRSVLQQKYKMNAGTVGGDFEWVQLPTSQMRTALKARRIEAALVPNLEAVLTEKEGLYRPVLVGQKEIHDLYGVPMPATFLGSYDESFKKRPEIFKALVALLKKSADYMKANPDEVYAGVAKEYGIKPEDLTVWMSAFGDFPIVIGKDDRKGMEQVWKSSQSLGLLKSAPPPVESLVWEHALSE